MRHASKRKIGNNFGPNPKGGINHYALRQNKNWIEKELNLDQNQDLIYTWNKKQKKAAECNSWQNSCGLRTFISLLAINAKKQINEKVSKTKNQCLKFQEYKE